MFVESAYSGEQYVKQRALDEQFVETKTEGGKTRASPQFSSSSAAPATVEAFCDMTQDGLAAKVGSGLVQHFNLQIKTQQRMHCLFQSLFLKSSFCR